MGQVISYQNGFYSYYLPSDPGMEFLGLTAYNSTYTGMRWGMTYIPQPDSNFTGTPTPYYDPSSTTASWVQQFDTAVRFSKAKQTYPGVSAATSFIRDALVIQFCPYIDINVFGTLSTTALANGTGTICVYNCGLLPWTFSRTYATAGSGSTPVTVPNQRFSMVFTGINTLDFQTNNHIAFDRDLFQLR